MARVDLRRFYCALLMCLTLERRGLNGEACHRLLAALDTLPFSIPVVLIKRLPRLAILSLEFRLFGHEHDSGSRFDTSMRSEAIP